MSEAKTSQRYCVWRSTDEEGQWKRKRNSQRIEWRRWRSKKGNFHTVMEKVTHSHISEKEAEDVRMHDSLEVESLFARSFRSLF